MSSHGRTHYILARDAAAECSLSRDYVTRLAREGKIEAKRVGNAWHVSEASLKQFCARQGEARTDRHKKLARVRREEYTAVPPPAASVASDAQEAQEAQEAPLADIAPEHESAPAIESMRAAAHQHIAAKKHVVQHLQTAPLYAMHPMLDLAHRATALVGAVALIVGAYLFLSPPPLHTALGVMRDVMLGAAAAISSAHE